MSEQKPERQPEVVLVTEYMHPDHAWCHTRGWHERQYVQSILEVLDLLKERPDFRFYVDTYHEELLPLIKHYPNRLKEFHERLLEGSISVGLCGYSNPRPVDLIEELLVRNMVLGRRAFNRTFPGVNLDVSTIHDVPPGSSQMPQILTKAGYKYYAFSRPLDAMKAKGVSPELVWRAPDGSEILASCRMYGAMWVPEDFPDDYEDNWEKARQWLAKEFGDVTGPSGIAWLHRGSDDSRPLHTHWMYGEPKKDFLGLFDRWNETETAKVKWASPLEYFQMLSDRKDRLPIFEGIIDPAGWTYWHGHLGQESMFVYHFRLTEKLTALEKVLAQRTLSQGVPYPDELMEERWRKLLRTVAHAQLWLYAEDYDRFLRQARALESELDQALVDATAALALGRAHGRLNSGVDASTTAASGAQALSGSATEEPGDVESGKVAPAKVAVFNPHPHTVADVREIEFVFGREHQVRDFTVRADDRDVPHQIVEPYYRDDGYLDKCRVAVAVDLPPMGVLICEAVPKEIDPARLEQKPFEWLEVLEVESVSDTFAIKGYEAKWDHGVVSLQPEGSGVPIEGPIGALVFDEIKEEPGLHYGEYGQRHTFQPYGSRLIERGPVRTKVWVRGKIGPHSAEQTYVFSPYRDLVEVETRIFSSGDPGEFKLVFPAEAGAELHGGALFGHEARKIEDEPYVGHERLRKGSFYTARWLSVKGQDHGLLVAQAPGNYGWIRAENAVEHILLKNFELPAEGWEINCSGMREGRGMHVFRWAFVPVANDAPYSQLHRSVLDFNAPVVSAPIVGDGGFDALPADGSADDEMSGKAPDHAAAPRVSMSVSRDDIEMSALFGLDGDLMLRIYDTGGQGGLCTIKGDFSRIKNVQAVDFHGAAIDRPGLGSVDLTPDQITLSIGAWEILTLKLGL